VEGTVHLVFPEKSGSPEDLVKAVEISGGEVSRLRIRPGLPGLCAADLEIGYPESLLPGILSSLGCLAGVAIGGFRSGDGRRYRAPRGKDGGRSRWAPGKLSAGAADGILLGARSKSFSVWSPPCR
jgi:hypothetical protein